MATLCHRETALASNFSAARLSRSINAPAASAKSQKPTSATVQFLLDSAPPERIALKKSPLGSSTITSPLLRKLARYASRLR